MQTLIAERAGGSRTAFAAMLGVGTTLVSKWCDHGTAPRLDTAAKIAEVTGVSVDWLLGFPVPQYTAQSRQNATLAEDFAAYLAREIAVKLSGIPDAPVAATDLEVDGARALENAVVRETDDCIRQRDQFVRLFNNARLQVARTAQAIARHAAGSSSRKNIAAATFEDALADAPRYAGALPPAAVMLSPAVALRTLPVLPEWAFKIPTDLVSQPSQTGRGELFEGKALITKAKRRTRANPLKRE